MNNIPPLQKESDHVSVALGSDKYKFAELTEPHRRELQIHCYRILGSLQDAEDMVQETFLRAWKRLDTYQGRASFRAWLYKIATNACLDHLNQRRIRRLLPTDAYPASDPKVTIDPPSTEINWLEPFPDEWLIDQAAENPEARYTIYESISLAFLSALQTLPPRQRATLILSDVLDWSPHEVADLLETTVPAINSALHRARERMAKQYHGNRPEGRSIFRADEQTQKLLDLYVKAWQSADVAGLVALLKKDATFAMPPSTSWYRGLKDIRIFTAGTIFGDDGMFPGKARGRWKLFPIRANNQPAFAMYQRAPSGKYEAFGVHVLECKSGQLASLTCFINPALPQRFNLPATL